MENNDIVIVSYARTPIGSFLGSLSSVSATKLGAIAIEGAIKKINLSKENVDQVIMGNVLSAGLGQAPARQAAIYSGLSESVECLTVNKMCGSGLKALMLAQEAILSGNADIVVAGGMENMSSSPHLLTNSRVGNKMGDSKLIDSMINDGLWDVYNNKHMGSCGEMCAEKYNFSREEQDEFARGSYKKSQKATNEGLFSDEITSVEVEGRKESVTIDKDEEPFRVKFDKIEKLRAVFKKDGTITAANASTINDGAAACILMSAKKAKELNIKPLAKILSQSSVAQAPEWFTTAPIKAIKKAISIAEIDVNNIDLFEINEAFSVVPMAAIKDLNIDSEKVNIYGGGVSLGHPIGASGARIMCTLLNAMNKQNAKLGLASLCIGGGEASAMIVEKIQ